MRYRPKLSINVSSSKEIVVLPIPTVEEAVKESSVSKKPRLYLAISSSTRTRLLRQSRVTNVYSGIISIIRRRKSLLLG